MGRRRSPLALFVVLVLAILGSAVLAAPALAKGHKKATHISGEIVLNPADNVSQPPAGRGHRRTKDPKAARRDLRHHGRGARDVHG